MSYKKEMFIFQNINEIYPIRPGYKFFDGLFLNLFKRYKFDVPIQIGYRF